MMQALDVEALIGTSLPMLGEPLDIDILIGGDRPPPKAGSATERLIEKINRWPRLDEE